MAMLNNQRVHLLKKVQTTIGITYSVFFSSQGEYFVDLIIVWICTHEAVTISLTLTDDGQASQCTIVKTL